MPKTKKNELKKALQIAVIALRQYQNELNWEKEEHLGCYDCHCPLEYVVFHGDKYSPGWNIANCAISELEKVINVEEFINDEKV